MGNSRDHPRPPSPSSTLFLESKTWPSLHHHAGIPCARRFRPSRPRHASANNTDAFSNLLVAGDGPVQRWTCIPISISPSAASLPYPLHPASSCVLALDPFGRSHRFSSKIDKTWPAVLCFAFGAGFSECHISMSHSSRICTGHVSGRLSAYHDCVILGPHVPPALIPTMSVPPPPPPSHHACIRTPYNPQALPYGYALPQTCSSMCIFLHPLHCPHCPHCSRRRHEQIQKAV